MLKYIYKIVFSLISSILIFSMMTVPVRAQDEYTEGELIYIIEDDSITITGCFGKSETITIPDLIGGIPVSKIGANAFKDSKVKTLILPPTIMTIAEGAIPANVQVIYSGREDQTQQQEEETVPSQPAQTEQSGSSDVSEMQPAVPQMTDGDQTAQSEQSAVSDSDLDGAEADLEEESRSTEQSQSKDKESSDTNEDIQEQSAGKTHSAVPYLLISVLAVIAIVFVLRRKRK